MEEMFEIEITNWLINENVENTLSLSQDENFIEFIRHLFPNLTVTQLVNVIRTRSIAFERSDISSFSGSLATALQNQ